MEIERVKAPVLGCDDNVYTIGTAGTNESALAKKDLFSSHLPPVISVQRESKRDPSAFGTLCGCGMIGRVMKSVCFLSWSSS